MGISGLLPFVKKASREINISAFAGSAVAVDAYCWLHKGAFSCAEKLVKGEPTDGYVHYVMKMVNMLLGARVKPILVFDGQNLPSKKQTELRRRENREKNRRKAKEFLREGKVREARECFQRCVDVTPQMAHEVILACRAKNVDCLVAPYEADAQLAYLCKAGIVQLVITEDSDLILFGCDKVLFKMDTGGHGILIEQSQLYKCLGIRAENFTFEKFRHTCILSGCDYLDSLPGIGLVKAAKFFARSSNPDLHKSLSRIPSYLRMPKVVVSTEYKESFVKADNTFLYQLVFCPIAKKLVPLNPYSSDIDPQDMNYAGKYFSDSLALEMAKGNINISTMKRFPQTEITPKKNKQTSSGSKATSTSSNSIWTPDYKVEEKKLPPTMQTVVKSTARSIAFASVPKSLLAAKSVKRKSENEAPVFSGPSDQDLLGIYGYEELPPDSSPAKDHTPEKTPAKKLKMERRTRSPLSERNDESSRSPGRETPMRNRFPETPSPVVRSRFFWSSSELPTIKSKPQSLLDDQTSMENTPPTKKPPRNPFSKIWSTKVDHLTNSPKVNESFKAPKLLNRNDSQTSIVSQESTFESQPDENSEDADMNSTQDYEESILSQDTTCNLNESLSQTSNYEVNSQKSVNLSQLTVCSMDKESFDLSPNSPPCVDLVSDDIVDRFSFCKKSVVPTLRVGLSKKKKKMVQGLAAGQQNLKDIFDRFRFNRAKSDAVS